MFSIFFILLLLNALYFFRYPKRFRWDVQQLFESRMEATNSLPQAAWKSVFTTQEALEKPTVAYLA
jgi:hypothetical protein